MSLAPAASPLLWIGLLLMGCSSAGGPRRDRGGVGRGPPLRATSAHGSRRAPDRVERSPRRAPLADRPGSSISPLAHAGPVAARDAAASDAAASDASASDAAPSEPPAADVDASEDLVVPLPPEARPEGSPAGREIDLLSVMRLAGAKAVSVEIGRERVEAARAEVDLATSRWLPELRAGVGYARHDGRFQETRGEVFDVSRSSLLAAPHLELRLDPADAYFSRSRAQRLREAGERGAERVRAEASVRGAILYLELLRSRALVEVRREAVAHSRAQVDSSRRELDLETGLRVDLERARSLAARDRQRLVEALGARRQASVELAVLLRLAPRVLLLPAEESLRPRTLIGAGAEVGELIRTALRTRPDLEELEARRRAAEERLSAERWRPWAPTIEVFGSYGAFAGGRGGFFGDAGDRVDVGVGISWTLEGLGLGAAARRRGARADLREADAKHRGAREEVAGEVLVTWERARSLRSTLEAARSRVSSSREALRLVRRRFELGEAIQLEVLESLREAAEARSALVAAITRYNQTQHLLHYRVHGRAWEGPAAARRAPEAGPGR